MDKNFRKELQISAYLWHLIQAALDCETMKANPRNNTRFFSSLSSSIPEIAIHSKLTSRKKNVIFFWFCLLYFLFTEIKTHVKDFDVLLLVLSYRTQ